MRVDRRLLPIAATASGGLYSQQNSPCPTINAYTTRLSSDLVDVRTAVDCAIERLRDFDVFVKLDRWSDLTYCILLGRSPVSRLMLLILVHVLCIHPGRIIHLFDVQ